MMSKPSFEASWQNIYFYLGLPAEDIDYDLNEGPKTTDSTSDCNKETSIICTSVSRLSKHLQSTEKKILVWVPRATMMAWFSYCKIKKKHPKADFYKIMPHGSHPVRCIELSCIQTIQQGPHSWLKRCFPWRNMPNFWVLNND